MDSGSLALLTLLISQERAHLLIIGAYRDNEVDVSHPLAKLIEEVKETLPQQVTEVKLKPLAVSHIAELLVDSFRCTEQAALPFANVLGQ
jgi:predicted ATPase